MFVACALSEASSDLPKKDAAQLSKVEMPTFSSYASTLNVPFSGKRQEENSFRRKNKERETNIFKKARDRKMKHEFKFAEN